MNGPPHVQIHPALERREVTFLTAFGAESLLRRVWPGQPSARSPWRPSNDGQRLELDVTRAAADPHGVAPWLRFLSRTFLAPSSATALEAALDVGLRGGHRLTGHVVVDGLLKVVVERNRVTEHLLPAPSVGTVAPMLTPVTPPVPTVVDLESCRLRSRSGRPRRSAPRSHPS